MSPTREGILSEKLRSFAGCRGHIFTAVSVSDIDCPIVHQACARRRLIAQFSKRPSALMISPDRSSTRLPLKDVFRRNFVQLLEDISDVLVVSRVVV